MKRSRLLQVLAALTLAALAPVCAAAEAESIGLGISLGMAFPRGSTPGIASTDGQASFDWGFYVNIPIIYTFHLTPSSELYKFDAQNATDMSIAFKFIVPLPRFEVYAGAVPGLTAVGDIIAPNVGLLGGASFPLVGNLSAFVQGKYKWLFQGDHNLRVFHIGAGMLFSF
jgi:hypothetical protein